MNRNDSRMDEVTHCLGFAQKSRHRRRTAEQRLSQEFDCAQAIVFSLQGTIHAPAGPRADLLLQDVFTPLERRLDGDSIGRNLEGVGFSASRRHSCGGWNEIAPSAAD